uniref:Uncharacterized protein n=1 Tax=Pavo cristatus TaxID=9049 RepID=A0A8C9G2U6_PAVCR
GTDVFMLYMSFYDDSISAASTSDVQDRLSALELRVQQQEDEITVLKAALADVLRRLAASEDHVASVRKSAPSKGKLHFVNHSFLSFSKIKAGWIRNSVPCD